MHDFSILSQIQSPPAVLTLYAWIRNQPRHVRTSIEVEEEGTHQFAGSAAEEENTTLQLLLL